MSKQTTYTPGPWEIHNNIGRKGELGVVAEGTPCIIANAALIAAVPELLQACKAATLWLETPETARLTGADWRAVLDQCRTAIAKAEGQ